jgi:hypothetical protein
MPELFNLEAMAKIDGGRIAKAFEQELQRAFRDCEDRPGAKAPRKITITVSVIPKAVEEGGLDSIDVSFQIKGAIPDRESKTYNMLATQGGPVYQELSPEDARQTTMPFSTPRPVDGDENKPDHGKEKSVAG